MKAERVVASGDRLGECPIWDERMGVLWWVDIHGQALRRWDGEETKTFAMPSPPGSIALRREGGMLVALEGRISSLGTTEPQLLVRPPEHAAPLRFNDGRCD
ncbi:MAG TPA: SMP-30/gluconolactonase/LRE family protein, partial [Burkholderiales bacterium]|nr:SMP-30/gluconolactonase/LRE family protein [Burkholderiales bacterium]